MTSASNETPPPLGHGMELFGAIQTKLTRAKLVQRLFGEVPEPIRIGRYVAVRTLGSGGMGTVWEAYDQQLGRKVALKLLNSFSRQRQDMVERLQREAQALARLSHPNVVTVYEVGEDDGKGFISMEFVDGPDLREHCRELDWRDTLEVYMDAGRGLAAAHMAGIFHRDFKPENVLVGSDGRARVLDFGLARGSEDPPLPRPATLPPDASLTGSSILLRPITRSGQVMGTPRYMAPEQCVGDAVDERSDQFSFAVALYEALYDEHPFEGSTATALREAALAGEVRPAPSKTDVPLWLRKVLVQALSGDPQQRHPSMQAMLGALGRDPRAWLLRSLVAFFLIAAAVGVAIWRGEVRETQAQLEAQRAREREAYAKERERLAREGEREAQLELQARIDGVTITEIRLRLERDPTRAVAGLRLLSDHAKAWNGEARMIASDAAYLGIARSVMELPKGPIPHGMSPDATVVAMRDPKTGSLTLVDTRTGDIRQLTAHEVAAPFVAFSPDSSYVAAKRSDGEIGIWNLSGKPYVALDKVPEGHQFLRFFADGTRLVSYGRDRDAYVWDKATGKRTVLPDHEDGVVAAIVSDDARFAATVDGYGVVRRWDLRSATPQRLVGNAPIAFTPDATLLVAVGAGDVMMYPPASATSEVLLGRGDPLHSLEVSEDGTLVVAGLLDGGVLVWDAASGEARRLPGHADEIVSLGFLPEDRFVVTTSTDNTLGIWDTQTPHAQRLRGHRGVGFWAVDEDAQQLVTVGWEGEIRRWDLPPEDLGPSPSHPGRIEAIAHGPDRALATGGKDGIVQEWDGKAWLEVTRHDAAIRALAYGPGTNVLVSGDDAGGVRVRGDDGRVRELPTAGGTAASMDLSADGHDLLVAQEADGIAVYDLRDDGVRTIDTAPFKPRWLGCDATCARVTSIGWVQEEGFSLRIHDVATGKEQEVHALRNEAKEDLHITAAAFSAAADRVAFSTSLRGVHVWDAASVAHVHLGDHHRLVYGIDIAPDGRTIATASQDETVRLWDAETERSRAIELRQGGLQAVAFAPDGLSFAIGGRNRLVYVGRDDLPRDQDGLRRWIDEATSLVVEPQPLD